MKLPHTTPRQQELIRLIYRYRFLERKQVQAFLGHTDKRRISAWLKELRDQQFIDWFYEPGTSYETSKPAIYFIDLNGIRFLRQDGYPEAELRKRYKEFSRQPDFVSRCLLLADCALHLEARNKSSDKIAYQYAVEADYTDPGSGYSFLNGGEYIRPQLAFTKKGPANDGPAAVTYLVEIFDITTPRYMVKKKLKGYIAYLQSDERKQVNGS